MESSEGDYHPGIFDPVITQITTNPLTAETVMALLVMVLLLICSAMISGAEVAYFSLSKRNVNELQKDVNATTVQVLKLLEEPRTLLATILVANNLVNIAIIIISYFISSKLFNIGNDVVEFVLNAIVISFILVLFGEVIPKVYANYHNISFAKLMVTPLGGLKRLFLPVSKLLINSTRLIEKRLQSKNGNTVTREEIHDAIDIASDETTTEEEVNILKGIVKFGNITVKQVMCSRVDIEAVEIHEPFKEVLATVLESGYSRIPVFVDDIDHIEGVLYAKDLLQYLDAEKEFQWPKLVRPPFFVPEYKKIEDLLKEFKAKRTHLAIVIDEYGGTSGIVTLEDIMEEIIGEIKDEFDDVEELDFEKMDDHNFVFEGKTLINDFCKIMEINQDEFDSIKGDADSLAGLLLEITQKIPHQNEMVKYKNFCFTVLSVTKKRIQKVKISILNESEYPEEK